MVIENVRQLRHDVDDTCPIGPDGKRQHTYDYREGGCRQVRDVEVTRQPRLGQSRHRLGHGHAARLRGSSDRWRSRPSISGMSLQHRRPRPREPGVFPPLRGARLPPAALRRLRAAALPADHRLPVVRQPARALDPGGGARARCIPIPRCTTPSSRRSSAHTPYLVLLVDLDTQKGQPTPARGVARGRQSGHAGRQAGAARGWWRGSASARACAWCSRDVTEGLALPQWTLDAGAAQPARPWRYPDPAAA